MKQYFLSGCGFGIFMFYLISQQTYTNDLGDFTLFLSKAVILYLVAQLYWKLFTNIELGEWIYFVTVGVPMILVWETLNHIPAERIFLLVMMPVLLLCDKYFSEKIRFFFIGFMLCFPFIVAY